MCLTDLVFQFLSVTAVNYCFISEKRKKRQKRKKNEDMKMKRQKLFMFTRGQTQKSCPTYMVSL